MAHVKGVLLLSGGIDSLALAYWTRPTHTLTVDYGQRAAAKEKEVAGYIAAQLGIEHQILTCDICALGAGTMLHQEAPADAPTPEWWPFRNQFLISLAAMAAVRADVGAVMIGTVSTDRQHADGRPEFLEAIHHVLACQERSIQILAPALELTSQELIRRSQIPKSLLACAHSCHSGALACGQCRGCHKHEEIFSEFGLI